MITWQRDPDGLQAKVLGHELYIEFTSTGWSAEVDGSEVHKGRRYRHPGRAKRVCLQAIGTWDSNSVQSTCMIAGHECRIIRVAGRYDAFVDGEEVGKKQDSQDGFSIQDEAKRACIRHIVALKERV